MMSSEIAQAAKGSEPKKRRSKDAAPLGERLFVGELASQKIARWMDQIAQHFGGNVRVSKSDIAAVVLESCADTLGKTELQALWTRCFDPVKFAGQVARQLKQAKSRGENVSLEHVVAQLKSSIFEQEAASPKRRARKPKLQPGTADSFIAEDITAQSEKTS